MRLSTSARGVLELGIRLASVVSDSSWETQDVGWSYPGDFKEVKSCRMLCRSLLTSGLCFGGDGRPAGADWEVDGCVRAPATTVPASTLLCVG